MGENSRSYSPRNRLLYFNMNHEVQLSYFLYGKKWSEEKEAQRNSGCDSLDEIHPSGASVEHKISGKN